MDIFFNLIFFLFAGKKDYPWIRDFDFDVTPKEHH